MGFEKGNKLYKIAQSKKEKWKSARTMKLVKPPHGDDPRRIMIDGRKQPKPYVMPEEYEPGFLRDMDKRSGTYIRCQKNFDKICNQLGGEQELSLLQISFVEHYVFLQEMMEYFEAIIARRLGWNELFNKQLTPKYIRFGKKKSLPPEIMAAMLKCLSTLTTLGKTIGLKKRKVAGNLRSYLGNRSDVS